MLWSPYRFLRREFLCPDENHILCEIKERANKTSEILTLCLWSLVSKYSGRQRYYSFYD